VTAGKAIDFAATALRSEIAACTYCAGLPLGPRPVVQFSPTARVLIIGQAPGTRVHASGVPWDDPSGDRLRQWTGLSKRNFYDSAKVALVGMGFCYPGKGDNGDLPPRPECAPRWHERVFALLPADRLTLLVGMYAQQVYLPRGAQTSLTARVEAFKSFGPSLFPLPHPSWRSVGWGKRNPWFESVVQPALREAVQARLG
jgi:uracil-DNA glycosylase